MIAFYGSAIYVLFGIITIFIMAYDPYDKSFDFSLSDEYEFWRFQRYFIWLIVIIASPIFFFKDVKTKISERNCVKDWHTKGHFTKKL